MECVEIVCKALLSSCTTAVQPYNFIIIIIISGISIIINNYDYFLVKFCREVDACIFFT